MGRAEFTYSSQVRLCGDSTALCDHEVNSTRPVIAVSWSVCRVSSQTALLDGQILEKEGEETCYAIWHGHTHLHSHSLPPSYFCSGRDGESYSCQVIHTGQQVGPSREEVAPIGFHHSYSGHFSDLGFSWERQAELPGASRSPGRCRPTTCHGSSCPAVSGVFHTQDLPMDGTLSRTFYKWGNEDLQTHRNQDALKMSLGFVLNG